MNGDTVLGLVEKDAIVANAEPEQPLERAAKRLHLALTGPRVAVDFL
jgi:hypothetical protein